MIVLNPTTVLSNTVLNVQNIIVYYLFGYRQNDKTKDLQIGINKNLLTGNGKEERKNKQTITELPRTSTPYVKLC